MQTEGVNMAAPMPVEILKELFRVQQKMPQAIFPLPSGYSVTFRIIPIAGRGMVFTGYMFGGHQADGTAIPGYDLVTGKGITWQATYVNKAPLEKFVSKTFYLTAEYLYTQLFYGPRAVTEYVDITVINTLDLLVYFSQTAFLFELPLEKIFELFAPGR